MKIVNFSLHRTKQTTKTNSVPLGRLKEAAITVPSFHVYPLNHEHAFIIVLKSQQGDWEIGIGEYRWRNADLPALIDSLSVVKNLTEAIDADPQSSDKIIELAIQQIEKREAGK